MSLFELFISKNKKINDHFQHISQINGTIKVTISIFNALLSDFVCAHFGKISRKQAILKKFTQAASNTNWQYYETSEHTSCQVSRKHLHSEIHSRMNLDVRVESDGNYADKKSAQILKMMFCLPLSVLTLYDTTKP